jgi:predicted nucleic acid-binding protein
MGESMIYVDANYWIYWFDERLPEHRYVLGVMRRAVREGIVMNIVTLMEVAHFFRRLPAQDLRRVMERIKGLEGLELYPLDEGLAEGALEHLVRNAGIGVGGRDSVILSTMEAAGTRRIATHDEVFKRIPGLRVVDTIPAGRRVEARGSGHQKKFISP